MNEQARACAAYFQSRPGYSRILSELLKKYRSYGRPAGTIRLDGATQSEASRSLLQGCAGTDLEASAEAVKQFGRAGYQELLIPLLEAGLTQTP